jgi:tripartite-type tricarboxylate transporter receptor subunit TctC
MTIRQPLILVVPPQLKISTVPQLIALARSQPAALNYASAGNGSPNHLAAEMFKVMGGVNVTHVPYKGAAPAEIDVMAGRVALFFDTMLSAIPFVKDGRLKALAVTSAARSTSMPALPTVAESGVKGYEFWTWNGFFVPAGTPAAIIADLNREIANILNTAEVQRRLTTDGAEIAAGSPQALAAYAKGERAKLARVISAAGIRIE